MSAEEPTLKDVWQAQQEMRQSYQEMWQSQQEMRQSYQEMRQSQQEMWRLLSSMNRRFGERFDVLEQQIVAVGASVAALDARVSTNEAKVTLAIGALKESIEARDFRLDDHGRRLTALEEKLP
jgi:septation ring formation regulator EzrA